MGAATPSGGADRLVPAGPGPGSTAAAAGGATTVRRATADAAMDGAANRRALTKGLPWMVVWSTQSAKAAPVRP